MVNWFNKLKYFYNVYVCEVHILTLKDPCKECIIKACCSEKCNEYHYVQKISYPFLSLRTKKIWIVSHLIGHTSGIIILIYSIFKIVN